MSLGNSGNCGEDWISYSDTKCFKVLDIKGSETEGKAKCSKLDMSSTLITIGSLNEQKFIEKLVQKYNTLSDRVWIGLEWNDNSFKWMDGSDVSYEDWDENAVKNGNNKCVQMSLSNSELGKWIDDDCTRKYLIACQKKQSSKTVMTQQINNLTKVVENLSLEVIPIGFLYTRFPYQSSPDVLWPNMKWTEVTQSYAGLFFRAEGNGSLNFGHTQQDNAPHLTGVGTLKNNGANPIIPIDTKIGGTSGWIYTGDGNVNDKRIFLNFKMSGGEVRPKNMAVKIWKRTG